MECCFAIDVIQIGACTLFFISQSYKGTIGDVVTDNGYMLSLQEQEMASVAWNLTTYLDHNPILSVYEISA